MKIGIDILGGDFAPDANIAGAVLAKKELPQDAQLVLIRRPGSDPEWP